MKKSRKDLFRKAVADNLSQRSEETSELGDFVSDMKRSRDEGNDSRQSEPKQAAGSAEAKNSLPEQKEEKETGKAMESRLKRLTAGETQPAAFADDDEPPRWRRFAVFGVVGILVLLLGYWALFAPGSRPTVYLSNAPIEEAVARNLRTANLTFPKNKTVYLFFAAGGRIGQDKVVVKLTEIYADSSNMMKEETVAQIESSVRSSWRYFTTQFQKEYFDHGGRYRVHVLAPNGEVIASQEFRIQ
ncbi:MAG: hypothetical protein ACOY5B_06490 [Spirochaetota bacterium]